MKSLGNTKNKITKNKKGKNVLHLGITVVVLVPCNIVSNDYWQDSTVLCTFVPSKPFGNFLEISPTNFIFLKTFKSEFSDIAVLLYVWFTDQNSPPKEIEDRIN